LLYIDLILTKKEKLHYLSDFNFAKMKLILLFFIVALFSCGVKSVKNDTQEKESIVFGSGGGFTGVASYYKLLKNGDIYRTGNSDSSFIFVGKLEGNQTKQLFDNYTFLKIDSLQLNEPGNRYYFIEKINSFNQKHKVTWGYKALDDKSLAVFHEILMKNVKNLNEKK
jgi:hypothetical protein